MAWLSRFADLDLSARRFGALQRVGKLRDGAGLLRLALMYGPGGLSLRGVAAVAADVGLATLSDKAVLGRLRKMADWLEFLLGQLLLQTRREGSGATPACAMRLIDGTMIRGLGEMLTTDRGYARVSDFKATLAAGGTFISRIGWRALRLRTLDGQPFDPPADLPVDDRPIERRVRVHGLAQPLRFVIAQIPDEKVAKQRQRVARRAARSDHRITPQTTLAAGYLVPPWWLCTARAGKSNSPSSD